MATPAPGDIAPDFTLLADDGTSVTLSALRGKSVILYFYPRDDTPGCTTEACDFRDRHAAITDANAVVLGVSPDAAKAHVKFKTKYGLDLRLASDPDGALIEALGSWVEKSMYGRTYFGIDRSTFLIDKSGRVARIWHKVKVPGHVEEVLAAAQAIA